MMSMRCMIGLICAVLFVGAVPVQGEMSFWSGSVARDGESMAVDVRLEQTAEGWRGALDLPDTHRIGLPLATSEETRGVLSLGFGDDEPFGGNVPYRLTGKMSAEKFDGELTLQGFTCPVTLTRIEDPRPYTTEEVTFENGDVTLAGTVFTPKTPGPHPGVVLIHGSGDNERWWRFGHADFFARQGFTVLGFDKRGNGGSTGNWRLVGFEPLARDGLAGIHLLQARPNVDPKNVGFWGISQAGWIMPLAASIAPEDVAFIVTTSGATVSVAEEIKYDYLVRLRDAGFGADALTAAERILDLDQQVTMTGEGYDELRALVKAAHDEPWWKTFDFQLIPAGARVFSKLIGGFDPRPILDEIDTPILWMYGEADKSVEPSRSIAILNQIMAARPKRWTIKTFPAADHGLRVPLDPKAAFPLQHYAPGHWETIAAWLGEHVLAGT